MEHRDHISLADFSHLSVHRTDLCAGHELAHRITSQCNDDARIDGFDLTFKIRIARCQLLRLRIAISWRSAFDHVADKNIRAFESGLSEELVEKLSRRSDERAPLFVFIKTGTFANEHDLGIRRTFTRHGFLARMIQRALLTNPTSFATCAKISSALISTPNHPGSSRWHP